MIYPNIASAVDAMVIAIGAACPLYGQLIDVVALRIWVIRSVALVELETHSSMRPIRGRLVKLVVAITSEVNRLRTEPARRIAHVVVQVGADMKLSGRRISEREDNLPVITKTLNRKLLGSGAIRELAGAVDIQIVWDVSDIRTC
jgi:hypothetical protein